MLTAALAGLYLLTVFLLHELFQVLTGQTQSEVATVVSTLAIAAAFLPVRARVQQWIDSRFYRRKYDAAQTVAAFGASLRDEVHLGELSDSLLRVVEYTMQPQHVSLWLKRVGRGRPNSYDEMDRR